MPTSLDALRDIHLPEPIAWWPPAFGYWIVLALILAAAVLWIRRFRQYAVRRAATRELKVLADNFATHNDAHELARNVNVMLRRTVLSLEPRHEVAAVTGERWIHCVHSCVAASGFEFSDGIQRLLSEGVYQPSVEVNAGELMSECRAWIRALPARSAA